MVTDGPLMIFSFLTVWISIKDLRIDDFRRINNLSTDPDFRPIISFKSNIITELNDGPPLLLNLDVSENFISASQILLQPRNEPVSSSFDSFDRLVVRVVFVEVEKGRSKEVEKEIPLSRSIFHFFLGGYTDTKKINFIWEFIRTQGEKYTCKVEHAGINEFEIINGEVILRLNFIVTIQESDTGVKESKTTWLLDSSKIQPDPEEEDEFNFEFDDE